MRKISNLLRKGKGKGVREIVAAETGKTGKENIRDCSSFEIIKALFLQQYLDPGIIFLYKGWLICFSSHLSLSLSQLCIAHVFFIFFVSIPRSSSFFQGTVLFPVGILLPWLTSVNILCRNTNILGNL